MADNAENLGANPITQPIQANQPPAQSNHTKSGFFQEDNGTYSSMRLMSFVSLISAIGFGVITLWLCGNGKNDSGNGVIITFSFLLGAFAPKSLQKFAEQKINKL